MSTLVITLVAITFALGIIATNFLRIRQMPESTPDNMLRLAAIIRDGANIFMWREYRVIVPVVLFVAGMFSLFVEPISGLTLLLGSCASSGSCIISMRAGTYGNVYTAEVARTSQRIGDTQQIGICGGSVGGLSVHGFGLLAIAIVILLNFNGLLHPADTAHGLILNIPCNPAIVRLTTCSLGCSIVAMFNRVAGGNYTKAADISADIVAKNGHNMPEDDCRMPNTIADFIGDCVNDIAGNCSDLLESFVATIVSSILIATIVYQSVGSTDTALLGATITYPIALASGGLIGCVASILYATMHRSSAKAAQEVDMITYISAGITIIIGAIFASLAFGKLNLYSDFRFGWASPWLASLLGIASGVVIGKVTEYYTGLNKSPVRIIAEFAKEGVAFLISKGDAVGDLSCLAPMIIIVVALSISYAVCGVYGIAIAALGMLSFVGATVTVDAFGPIADNAGGIAESCHLPPEVREITDELDALGNTTAAVGKGAAIGSAAFATLALMIAYVGSYSDITNPVLNLVQVPVIAGALIGSALVPYFSALLTNNTIDSAYLMAEEGERQLAIPGVMEGTVRPDYEKLISMASEAALKKMLKPSIIAIIVPAMGGILFGPEFVGGILIGSTLNAIPKAIYMGNSGGAFDNAKKRIEAGLLEGYGKGSEAHKAAVAGDTVGDTRKDVVGVALDIFIKTMSTVANTLAPVFVAVHPF